LAFRPDIVAIQKPLDLRWFLIKSSKMGMIIPRCYREFLVRGHQLLLVDERTSFCNSNCMERKFLDKLLLGEAEKRRL
jgi:hypothetical protein